jgi:hypothetical protein
LPLAEEAGIVLDDHWCIHPLIVAVLSGRALDIVRFCRVKVWPVKNFYHHPEGLPLEIPIRGDRR